jgi:hypothetical protein
MSRSFVWSWNKVRRAGDHLGSLTTEKLGTTWLLRVGWKTVDVETFNIESLAIDFPIGVPTFPITYFIPGSYPSMLTVLHSSVSTFLTSMYGQIQGMIQFSIV